jgi:diamine N-acetyltransferase
MSPSNIRIRKAGLADAALIAELSQETFFTSMGPFNSKENMEVFMKRTFSREKLMAEVGAEKLDFFLGYIENKAVGYVKLKEGEPPGLLDGLKAIEISRIYVLPEAIGKGLGHALMQSSLDFAQGKGKDLVWLGVWEHNRKAIGFYEKWGFERFGEHLFMLGNDPQTDWLMKKTVRIF